MTIRSGATVNGVALTTGRTAGPVRVLDQPISFWGGVDPRTGVIIDRHHPQMGQSVAHHVLILPCGRGSSSSSSVLAEAIRNLVGPVAIVLATKDPILVIGCLVAEELYGVSTPIVVVDSEAYRLCTQGHLLFVDADAARAFGTLTIVHGSDLVQSKALLKTTGT